MNKTEQGNPEHPSISVAIATYNGEKYLEEQLDSILSQTLKPAEIIVCDDRSTDGTVKILEQYSRKGLLSYYVNEHRLGFIGNFKKAVSLCSPANYIALSDQDDIWLPSKLKQAAEYLQKIDDAEHPVMVYSDLILVDQDKNIINYSFRDELGQAGYHYCLETPTFQIVDEPELPLKKNRTGYLISIIYGGLIAGAAGALYLLIRRKSN